MLQMRCDNASQNEAPRRSSLRCETSRAGGSLALFRPAALLQVSWRSKSCIAIKRRLILFVDSIEFALDLLYAQGFIQDFVRPDARGVPVRLEGRSSSFGDTQLRNGLTLWFTGLSGAG